MQIFEIPTDDTLSSTLRHSTGMGDQLGLGTDFKAHGCLDFILQELQEYPGMGIKLIETALNSPVIRNRNGACNVLEAWIEKKGMALTSMLPELAQTVQNVLASEIDEKLKERYKSLLQ